MRNADGNIIQFSYGEDGFDYCKIESQGLDHCEIVMNNLKIIINLLQMKISMINMSNKELKNEKDYMTILDNYFNQITEDYRFVNEEIFYK